MTRTVRSAGFAAAALCLTAALVGVLAEQPAMAQDLTITADELDPSFDAEFVSTAGLDLTTERGVKRLHTRVRTASQRVCSVGSFTRINTAELDCREGAMAMAVPQVERLVKRTRELAAAGLPTRLALTVRVAAPARN